MKGPEECGLAVVGLGFLSGSPLDRLLTCGECVQEQIIAYQSDPAPQREDRCLTQTR